MRVLIVPRNENSIRYRRANFSTRLPKEPLYTPSHFWIQELEKGLWKVGFTKFAVRMLGEIVEAGFELEPGNSIRTGDIIGWVEGFKAITDIYCAIEGTFQEANPLLEESCEKIYNDPYGKGWLYLARGIAEKSAFGVNEYVQFLDTTIKRIQGENE